MPCRRHTDPKRLINLSAHLSAELIPAWSREPIEGRGCPTTEEEVEEEEVTTLSRVCGISNQPRTPATREAGVSSCGKKLSLLSVSRPRSVSPCCHRRSESPPAARSGSGMAPPTTYRGGPITLQRAPKTKQGRANHVRATFSHLFSAVLI